MDNVERMYRHLVRTIRSKFPQYLTQPFDVGELHQTILPYRFHRRELGLESNEDYEITLSELLAGGGAHDFLIVDDQMRETLKRELATPNPDPSAFKQFARSTVALSPAALRSLEAGPDDPSTPLRGPVVSTLGTSGTPRPDANRASTSAALRATTGADAFPSPSNMSAVSSAPIDPVVSATAATPPADLPEQSPPALSLGAPSTSSATTAASVSGGTTSAVGGSPSASRTPVQPRTSKPVVTPTGARAIIPEPGEQCRACNELLPPGRPITFCPHCGQNLTTMNCPACGSELEVGWKFCAVCGRPASAG